MKTPFIVLETRPEHFAGITELSRAVYPTAVPWSAVQLANHVQVFPDGQRVVVESTTGRVVGMSASLIVLWDDYEMDNAWRDFTAMGTFANHDPANGRTLYGAEIMVHPDYQGRGIGSQLYEERRRLVLRLDLLRIRAGARLRGYHRYASTLTPEAYVARVVSGQLHDETLTFQLRRGFRVLAVVSGYLQHDPESLGYAAVIEWLNQRTRPEAGLAATASQ